MEINNKPLALEASTIPLDYRRGGALGKFRVCLKYDLDSHGSSIWVDTCIQSSSKNMFKYNKYTIAEHWIKKIDM